VRKRPIQGSDLRALPGASGTKQEKTVIEIN